MGVCASQHVLISAKRLASVTEQLVVAVDANEYITYSSTCEWLKVSESALVGKTVSTVFDGTLAECLKQPQSLKLGDKRRHRVRWTVVGNGVYALSSLTEEDTRSERRDELVAQTETLKNLRTHFTDVPYHLAEPLRGLVALSDTLCSMSTLAPRATYDVIKEVSDAVDYSSPAVIHLNESITTLGRVLREVERSFEFRRFDESVRFYVSIDPELADIRLVFDSRAVVRVLSNLLDNSFKFTPAGSVRLEVTRCGGRHVREFVRFKVTDTGSTIPEETATALLEPIRTEITRDRSQTEIIVKSTELGVGLQTVRRLVTALGGTMECERLSEGTVVSFVAPFIPYDLPVRQIAGKRTLSFALPVAVRAQKETIEASNVYVYSSSAHVRNDTDSTLRALMFKNITIIRNGAKLVESLCDNHESLDIIVVDEASADMRPHTIREAVSKFTDRFVSIIVLTKVAEDDQTVGQTSEYMVATKQLRSLVDALNRHFAEVEQHAASDLSE